jgi:hypothetical protein
MIAFLLGGFGQRIAKSKVTYEKGSWARGGGGVKFRKTSDKTLMGATKKVIKWLEKWKVSVMSELKENVNEGTITENNNLAVHIGKFTGTRSSAVDKFIDAHGIDAVKLLDYVKNGTLQDRLTFVAALAGNPNNPKFKKIIKLFGEGIASVGAGTIPTGPESVGVKVKPDFSFKGMAGFDCSANTFGKCLKGKEKHKRWNTYLDRDSELVGKVKNYMGQSYKNTNFILRNSGSGEMVVARRS